MLVENMITAPIIGYYNQDIINLSKKIASAYNKSVHKLNEKTFLGFNFELIPEIKGKKQTLILKISL